MNTKSKKFNISRITFETGDNEVVLSGTMFKGLLNYASELIVNFSQLNVILNQLATNNAGFDIQKYLTKQHMYDEQFLYEINLNQGVNGKVNLAHVDNNEMMRQIRA